MSTTHSGDEVSHRTIDRMAAILDQLAGSPSGCSLTELAHAADAPLTTTQGIVRGLVHNGYAEQHQRLYVLGRATYLLNRRAGRELLPGVSRSLLSSLHHRLRLSVVLSARIGTMAYYIDHMSDDPRFARLAEDLIERPLLHNSSGWVHLAGMKRPDLWNYLSEHENETELVSRFLSARHEIATTDLCVTPKVSTSGEGIAIGVRSKGNLVSVLSVIGTPEEINRRKKEIVKVLLAERDGKWMTCPLEVPGLSR